MKEQEILATTWGLHLGSYLMASMPYLQIISLMLAMTASILTIIKLTKKPKKGE
jgi:F0F1-type ATP synthase assembly protein I